MIQHHTDRVYYSHLELDTEYKLVSKLIDKETGEVVVDDKGLLQEMETSFSTRENASQEKYVMGLQKQREKENGIKDTKTPFHNKSTISNAKNLPQNAKNICPTAKN